MALDVQISQIARLHAVEGDNPVEIEGIISDLSDDQISIVFPQIVSTPSGFGPDERVVLKFWDKNGMHHAETVTVIVRTRNPSETDFMAKISNCLEVLVKNPASFETTQKRNFFRVRVELAASVRVLHSASVRSGTVIDAKTVDISAGGVRLLASLALAEGDEIEFAVTLPPASPNPGRAAIVTKAEPPLTLKGIVVRADTTTGTERAIDVGIQFSGLLKRDQDKIVGLLFALQRKSR